MYLLETSYKFEIIIFKLHKKMSCERTHFKLTSQLEYDDFNSIQSYLVDNKHFRQISCESTNFIFMYFDLDYSIRLTKINNIITEIFSTYGDLLLNWKLNEIIENTDNKDVKRIFNIFISSINIDTIKQLKYKTDKKILDRLYSVSLEININEIYTDTKTIMMGQIGFCKYTDKIPILSTFGLGPCHCLIVYDTKTKIALLSHIDPLSLLDKLENELSKIISNTLEIYLIGGEDNIKDTIKIYNILVKLNIDKFIKGTSLHKNKITSTIGVDTRNGKIDCYLDHNFKKIKFNEFSLIPKQMIIV